MQLFLRGQLIESAFYIHPAKLLVGEIQGGLPVQWRKRMGAGPEIEAQPVGRA